MFQNIGSQFERVIWMSNPNRESGHPISIKFRRRARRFRLRPDSKLIIGRGRLTNHLCCCNRHVPKLRRRSKFVLDSVRHLETLETPPTWRKRRPLNVQSVWFFDNNVMDVEKGRVCGLFWAPFLNRFQAQSVETHKLRCQMATDAQTALTFWHERLYIWRLRNRCINKGVQLIKWYPRCCCHHCFRRHGSVRQPWSGCQLGPVSFFFVCLLACFVFVLFKVRH